MLRVRSAGLQRIARQLLQHAEQSQAALVHLPTFAEDRQSAAATPLTPPQHWSLQRRAYASPASFKAAVSNARPQSLARSKDTGELPDDDSIGGLKHYLLKLGGFYSRESALARGSKGLYQTTVEQSEDPELKRALGLPDKFAATYSLLCLHVWLLLVRLRAEGDDGRDLTQILYEGFQDDVELRVHAEGVKVRVSKWLKDLEKMFYGGCESYEKALKGEEDLTHALLRNVYGDDPSQRHNANALTHYVRRELACLKMTPSEAVLGGKIVFSKLHSDRPNPAGQTLPAPSEDPVPLNHASL